RVLDSAYNFSRMLHPSLGRPVLIRDGHGGHPSHSHAALPSAVLDSAYNFSRQLGSALYPQQVELVNRFVKNERGERDCVGCTTFPG
ncbi:hypothetical protein B0H14DRAFT_2290422, partial [Mycena olivaceomarginata]